MTTYRSQPPTSRSREESERLEGKFMEDEWGLLIPYDASRLEEIAAKRAINEKKLEEQIAREAAEAKLLSEARTA